MAVGLMFLAGAFVSLSNLFLRKSADSGGTTKGFLVFQTAMGFLVAFSLNPLRTGDYAVNVPIAVLSILAGLVFAAFFFSLGRALENGPPGLTISILNGSTVMPAIVMALCFGAARGFPYTSYHAIGSLLVLMGLFWAGHRLHGLKDRKAWVTFAFSMFALHILILVLFQWRALLLNAANPQEIFSFFSREQIRSQWFMPLMFLTATSIQLAIFIRNEKRWPQRKEVFYGVLGGAANGLCTYFMIWATEVATPLENAVIYPVFSVVTIILSNLWGQRLYQEQVNWRACQVCALGLVVGTVDWKAVAAAIGF